MTERRSLSTMQRLRVFEQSGGRCHICERLIRAGERWEAEHRIPLALGGADDASNMAPAHVVCHSQKTKTDNASWTKAKRVKAKSIGIKKPPSFRKPDGVRFDWKLRRYVPEKESVR